MPRQDAGESPLGAYAEAETQLDAVAKLDPADAYVQGKRLAVYLARARYLYAHGASPRAIAPRVDEALAAA